MLKNTQAMKSIKYYAETLIDDSVVVRDRKHNVVGSTKDFPGRPYHVEIRGDTLVVHTEKGATVFGINTADKKSLVRIGLLG